MRDNFHEGWKVGIRQCHERERGWRGKRKCAINVDVDGELVEFRVPGKMEELWGEEIARNDIFDSMYSILLD